jgi:pyruvate dehydrogenase E1 component beta subunit
MAKKITMIQALNAAIDEEMSRDKRVFVIGEDVAQYGGIYGVTTGLFAKYGPDRVINAPISEQAYSSMAVGAAEYGKRPIAELMFADFAALSYDAIADQAAQLHYTTNGKQSVPIVFRGAQGVAGGAGPHHSQVIEAWFMNSPGLKIVCPTKPSEGKGLLKAAIRDDNPVLFLEHHSCYATKEEVPEEEYILEIGKAKIVREGKDVTLIANQLMREYAEKALEEVEKDGISVELIDPLTIKPFDKATFFESAKKTGRVIIVHEGRLTGGYGAEYATAITEECFADLKVPVKRVAGLDVPLPCGPEEKYVIPSVEDIVNAMRQIVAEN